MAFYDDVIIEQVREASDIVTIISEHLPLKRKGRNYWAKCPFHREKTASFSVAPDKQIYHCFGCQKGGNVFSFVMEYEHITFPEAIKYLAEHAGIQLPEKSIKRESKDIERLLYAHEVAADFFFEKLKESKKCLDYLQKRKLNNETIERFKLGYALDSWEALINHTKTKSLTEADLIKAGLVVEKEKGGIYDRFRDRLVFTIFSGALKPIAFGARTFDDSETAKYINSPETPLYHKSRILYGLSHSRGEIRRADEAIVVEGYFDYLSLYQAGIKNVVASSGTAFTREQAEYLGRMASSVVLMFDSDSAGQKAAIRSVDYLFEAGLDVRIVQFPKGEDPDSITRKGGLSAIEDQIAGSLSYVEYSLLTLSKSYEKLPLSEKNKALKRLTTLATKLDDSLKQELFLKEVALKYDIALDVLKSSVKPIPAKQQFPKEEPEVKSVLEENFLSILIQETDRIDNAEKHVAPTDFTNSSYSDIYNLLVQLKHDGENINVSHLIDVCDEKHLKQKIAALAAIEIDHNLLEQQYNDYLKAFDHRRRKSRLSTLKKKLAEAESENDQDKINYYYSEIENLNKETL